MRTKNKGRGPSFGPRPLYCAPFRWLLLLAIFIPLRIHAQQMAGYILEIQGGWTVAGKPVGMGHQLPGGSLLRNLQPADYDRVVVVDSKGGVLLTAECRKGQCYRCAKPGDCNGEITPLLESSAPSAVAVVFDAIMEMFRKKPDKYVFARVRGDSLSDSVLRLTDESCDLTPLMDGMDQGRYEVRFRSLPVEGRAAPEWQSATATLLWNPSKPSATVTVRGLREGLYEIRVVPPAGAAMTAWVLVAGGASYPKSQEEFKSTGSMVASWGDNVSAETADAYSRARLEYLATRLTTLAK